VVGIRSYHPHAEQFLAAISIEQTPPGNYYVTAYLHHNGKIVGERTATVTATETATATPTANPMATPMTTGTPSGSGLDQYGGTTSVQCSNGPAAHFYTEKVGDRWWLCDPAGNGFFMKGVAAVNYNMDAEQLALNETKYVLGPTGNWTLNWDLQMLHRLLAWGFNTIADDSYLGLMPFSTDVQWGGDYTIPVKLPYTTGINMSRYVFMDSNGCGAASTTKDMINGVGAAYTGWRYNYGDYFDPSFSSCVGNIIQANGGIHSFVTAPHNDYYLYFTIDESDQTGGLFGPGPDFPTLPSVSLSGNAAWITLVTAPTQTSNSTWGVSYSNTTVYTKQEFSNFMTARYSNSIAALNAAWGSKYTSFGSAGGWGVGSGLLDENGLCPARGTSACWLGDAVTLAGETAAMQADMSAFYTHYLDRYLGVLKTQYQNATYGIPGVMLEMGLGGFSTPPRREVLTEAAKYLDLTLMPGIPPPPWACASAAGGVCTDSQQRIDFVAQYLGDRPWINWEGINANPDSAESAYPSSSPYTTQAQRGAGYQGMVSESVNAKATPTSSYPVVGYYWWGAFDQDGEKLNWGLLTPHDNPYDGKSATIVGAGSDQWGYPTGGETENYGDFIDDVTSANEGALPSMAP
jgi:hypothetical protein